MTTYSQEFRAAAVAKFNALRARGVPRHAAAVAVGVAPATIYSWSAVTRAKATPSPTKGRPCLRCRQPFAAKHKFNRVCDGCRRDQTLDGLPDSWGGTATEGLV